MKKSDFYSEIDNQAMRIILPLRNGVENLIFSCNEEPKAVVLCGLCDRISEVYNFVLKSLGYEEYLELPKQSSSLIYELDWNDTPITLQHNLFQIVYDIKKDIHNFLYRKQLEEERVEDFVAKWSYVAPEKKDWEGIILRGFFQVFSLIFFVASLCSLTIFAVIFLIILFGLPIFGETFNYVLWMDVGLAGFCFFLLLAGGAQELSE